MNFKRMDREQAAHGDESLSGLLGFHYRDAFMQGGHGAHDLESISVAVGNHFIETLVVCIKATLDAVEPGINRAETGVICQPCEQDQNAWYSNR